MTSIDPVAVVELDVVGADYTVRITPQNCAEMLTRLVDALQDPMLRLAWQRAVATRLDRARRLRELAASPRIQAAISLVATPEQADELADQLADRFRPAWCPTHEQFACVEAEVQVCQR